MKYFILCATLFAVVFLSLPASATPLDDKVAALKKAIKEEVAAKPTSAINTPQSPAYANPGYVTAALDEILAQVDNPNSGGNAEAQIVQILAAFSSDAVQKAGQDLIAEIRLERKAHTDAAAAGIHFLLKRVSDDVSKAKKAEDLDGLLVDLQKFQGDRNGGYNAENQALYQQVAGAFEFTKLWQNYLSHLAAGQTQLATQDLQSLSQNNYSVGIMPRSQILDLLAGLTTAPKDAAATPPPPPTAVETILKSIKALDDMEPALWRIAPLRPNNEQAQQAYNSLVPYVQLYTDVKAGVPTNVTPNFGGNGFNNGPGISPELQAQLLLFVLQHYLDSYKGTPPTPDEKPQAFIDRVIADAETREDWLLLKKALTGDAYLNRNSSLGTSSKNVASVDNLLIAFNQEEARQYALAVVSYQGALKVADTSIPAKLIGDKLAAIQKDHPKEYDQGMQMVTSPPSRYYPGMIPGMPYSPGMPGYPGMPITQPNTGLSIPGVITNRAPVPTAPTTDSTNQPPVTPASPSTNAPPGK